MGGPRARRMGLQGLATLAIVGLSQAAAGKIFMTNLGNN